MCIEDALSLFLVSEAELLEAVSSRKVRAVYGTEDGPGIPRFLLSDLRQCFEELNDPAVAEKRSKLGWVVGFAGGAAAGAGGRAVDKLMDGTLSSAWNALVEGASELFREAPSIQTRPRGSGGGWTPVEGGARPTAGPNVAPRASGVPPRNVTTRPGGGYSTMSGPGPGFMTRGGER